MFDVIWVSKNLLPLSKEEVEFLDKISEDGYYYFQTHRDSRGEVYRINHAGKFEVKVWAVSNQPFLVDEDITEEIDFCESILDMKEIVSFVVKFENGKMLPIRRVPPDRNPFDVSYASLY